MPFSYEDKCSSHRYNIHIEQDSSELYSFNALFSIDCCNHLPNLWTTFKVIWKNLGFFCGYGVYPASVSDICEPNM